MKPKPLLKMLTQAGIGSRRQLADIIKQSRVTVNDEVVLDFRYPVNTNTDLVSIDGKPVQIKTERVVYLMLNKPSGFLSTVRDEQGRRTVLDLLPGKYRHLRLYPAGRLDKDSTGLLLLTNDGELTYRLTHPRFEHEKEYLIQIKGSLQPGEIKRLAEGIKLDEGKAYPVTVLKVKSYLPFNYSLIIHEGRKRQVRRMLLALGHPVLALKRIRIGNLRLGDLKEGAILELTSKEVRTMLGVNLDTPSRKSSRQLSD
ncbi:pseudouridine synthase [Chloroflexota bacterium]